MTVVFREVERTQEVWREDLTKCEWEIIVCRPSYFLGKFVPKWKYKFDLEQFNRYTDIHYTICMHYFDVSVRLRYSKQCIAMRVG